MINIIFWNIKHSRPHYNVHILKRYFSPPVGILNQYYYNLFQKRIPSPQTGLC